MASMDLALEQPYSGGDMSLSLDSSAFAEGARIPAKYTCDGEEGFSLKAGAGPVRQAVNDFNRAGYGSPCPPIGHGIHRYHFRLLALDVERLDLGDRARCKDVERAAEAHLIERAEYMGTYSR